MRQSTITLLNLCFQSVKVRQGVFFVEFRTPPPAVRTKEPEQLGERRVTIQKTAQAPILMVAYHAPEAKHADRPALEILARVLTQGRSSRLYRRMVDTDQSVQSVDASIDWNLDPGLFGVSAQLRAGGSTALVEKALYEEIARVVKDGVSAGELNKIRNLILVDFYKGLRTIAGKANTIGRFEVYLGDHRRLNTYPEEMGKVTVADVQRVASQYLKARNRTVATLVPEPTPEEKGK